MDKKRRIPEDIRFGQEKDVKRVWSALVGRERRVQFRVLLDESLYSFFQRFASEVQIKRKLNKKYRLTLGGMIRIGLKVLKKVCESNPEIFEEGTEEEIVAKIMVKVE
ncbi:MAG TPA: hypothetical protein P5150_01545 [Candidatus Ratteibacteria bacterium]|nr:hypothetical protein [Candidatus Ratteibacteria bacterium]